MSSRMVQLNALKQGMVRLRTKGGANPSTLYDLLNGYVTIDGSIKSRPGTVKQIDLPPGTKGMCVFHGKIVVFGTTPATPSDPKYVVVVISHPTDATQALSEIHFAAPFMGALYVVAEFANGDVFHFWLRSGGVWQADHVYKENDLAEPTVANGIAYRANADKLPTAWQPETGYAVGDVVQPTVYNGYKYTVTAVAGDNPSSGDAEPAWPETDGAQVVESVDSTASASDAPVPSTPPDSDRYGNRTAIGRLRHFSGHTL